MAQLVKNLSANVGDARDEVSILGSGRSPGLGNVDPLQYSRLEKSHGQRILERYSQGVAKSQTWLSARAHIYIHKEIYISKLHRQKTSVLKTGFEPLFFIYPPQTASFPTRCCVLISCFLRSICLPWSAILSPDFSLFQWQLSFQMNPGNHILWEISWLLFPKYIHILSTPSALCVVSLQGIDCRHCPSCSSLPLSCSLKWNFGPLPIESISPSFESELALWLSLASRMQRNNLPAPS